MLSRATFRVLTGLLAVYGLLWLPALVWDGYLASPAGTILALPYFSGYGFHLLGVPGMLGRGGACGWGWCALSAFGWSVVVLIWVLLAWLAAWRVGCALARRGGR